MKKFNTLQKLALAALVVLFSNQVTAEILQYEIVIKNHRFEPAELKVPAGQKIRLLIDNQDITPEEFESHSLNLEKIIPGKSKAKLFVRPLEVGEYIFFGEFNEATAQGKIVVEAAAE